MSKKGVLLCNCRGAVAQAIEATEKAKLVLWAKLRRMEAAEEVMPESFRHR